MSIGPLSFAIVPMNDLNPELSIPWEMSAMMPCSAVSTGARNGFISARALGISPNPCAITDATPGDAAFTKPFHSPVADFRLDCISPRPPVSFLPAVFAAVTWENADLVTSPKIPAPSPADTRPAPRPPTATVSPATSGSPRPVATFRPSIAFCAMVMPPAAPPPDRPPVANEFMPPASPASRLFRVADWSPVSFSAFVVSFSSCRSTPSFALAAAESIFTLMSGCSRPSSSAFFVIRSSLDSVSPSLETIFSMTDFTRVPAMLCHLTPVACLLSGRRRSRR